MWSLKAKQSNIYSKIVLWSREERGGEMGAERGLGRDQELKKTLTQHSGMASVGKEPEKEWPVSYMHN